MPSVPLPNGPAITEAAVWERLGTDPIPLLHTAEGRARLNAIYSEYTAVAHRNRVPIFLCAPTWRANRNNAQPGDNARALEFIALHSPFHAALMGPREDCYTPSLALGRDEARRFHAWQARELASAPLVLLATFPAVREALGILDVLEAPAVVSFVLTAQGTLLDGTPLLDAIAEIDASAPRPPVSYWINCTHPYTALAGLRAAVARGPTPRIYGLQANSSPVDPRYFAITNDFAADSPAAFAEGLLTIHREFSIPVLGGCCGTRAEHLEALAAALTANSG
ncbi:MAG TPA: homocysteine S-methyltransferase family protein [Bryobacteraceae bacterium]|nr:homocysteine S-methyltransferase family protein [Bryobacteraceae bacterium]